MLSRKLMAAFITATICYFIVPFFFHEFYDYYFIIGFAVSFVTVAILFTVGILSSVIIEYFSKKRNYFILHFVCGVVLALIFQLISGWDMGGFLTFTSIGFIYVMVFLISDFTIRKRSL